MSSHETTRSMHIALAVPSLPTGGGVAPVVMRLARGLAVRGHRVDIVMLSPHIEHSEFLPPSVRLVVLGGGSDQATHCFPAEFQRRVQFLDVQPTTRLSKWNMWIKILKLHKWNPRVVYLYDYVRWANAMLVYIRQNRPGCILTSLLESQNGTLLAAHFFPTPPIIPIVHGALPARWKRDLGRITHRLLLPYADHVVAVSQGLANNFVKLLNAHESQVSAIYNPAYFKELPKLAIQSPDHPWINDGGPPFVLAAGRFSNLKGFPTLIRAFRNLSKRRPLRLLILGDGGRRKRYESLIHQLGLSDKVSMPGRVDNPLAYMARAAVFVLSSRREGLANVLIEAMACGCPVVSTDCPFGPAEILEGGKWGELVPVDKDDELADAIERTLDNPLPREVLKRRAEFFSVDRAVDQYEQLIAEVVAQARSRT